MRLALKFFKQLEFALTPVVATPGAVVGQPGRLPIPKMAGGAHALQFVRRRDHVLEQQARELLRSLGAEKFSREIRVEWNPRLKTCAGRADYRQKLISLNPLLVDHNVRAAPHAVVGQAPRLPFEGGTQRPVRLAPPSAFSKSSSERPIHLRDRSALAPQSQSIDEIDRTLRHELAHLLAQWRVGRRRIAPHGIEWRQACRDLGIAEEARCHHLPFATKTYARRYVYWCPNCKEEFPRVRRIRRSIACLACCRKYNRGDFDARFRLKLMTKL